MKKATVQEEHIYFWDEGLNIGYLTPTIDIRAMLANNIWEMRGEELGRVQVKELMEAAIQGDAINVSELVAIKQRVLNPLSGGEFHPKEETLLVG